LVTSRGKYRIAAVAAFVTLGCSPFLDSPDADFKDRRVNPWGAGAIYLFPAQP
jgi:hypothetical protein